MTCPINLAWRYLADLGKQELLASPETQLDEPSSSLRGVPIVPATLPRAAALPLQKFAAMNVVHSQGDLT
jgi:hypothetical protein